MKKFLTILRRIFFGDDPIRRTFFLLTVYLFGAWSLAAVFVLAGGLRFFSGQGPIPMVHPEKWLDMLPIWAVQLAALSILVILAALAATVLHLWCVMCKERFAWLYIFIIFALVCGVAGYRWGAGYGWLAAWLLAVWVFPLAAFPEQWQLILLRGALWTFPVAMFDFPVGSFMIIEKLGGGPEATFIRFSPEKLLCQNIKAAAIAVMILAGYFLTSLIYARAAKRPWRRMFGRGVCALLALFSALYLLSVGMAFAARHNADRSTREAEKFFGAPLTAQAVMDSFHAGRRCDPDFWEKLDLAYDAMVKNIPEKWRFLAFYSERTLAPELLLEWKRVFRACPEIRRFEAFLDAPLPAAKRNYEDPIICILMDDVAHLRLANHLAMWRIRFAIADRDSTEALAALRRMENVREYLARDHQAVAFLTMINRCEQPRIDALEKVLSAGLLSDTELRGLQRELAARERESDTLQHLCVWGEAAASLNLWDTFAFCGLRYCGHDSDAPYPYRWLFPPLWYLGEVNRAEIAKLCRARSFRELGRKFPPTSDRNVVAADTLGSLRGVAQKTDALKYRYILMRKLVGIELEKRRTGQYPGTLKDLPADPVIGKPAQYVNGEFDIPEKPWDPSYGGWTDKPIRRKVRGIRLQSPDGKVSASIVFPGGTAGN